MPTELVRPLLPSATELLGWSFLFFRKHFEVIAGIAAVPFVFGVLGAYAGKSGVAGFIAATTLFSLVVGALAQPALFVYVVKEGGLSFSVGRAYLEGAHMLVPFFWVSGLAILAILGGAVLAVVPAILLSIWLSMSAYAYVAENRTGMLALISSWHYIKGYWGKVFWRYLVFGLVLFILSLGISIFTIWPSIQSALQGNSNPDIPLSAQLLNLLYSNFIAFPLGIIYSFGIYRALKEIKGAAVPETEERDIKKKLHIFMAVGIAGIVLATTISILVLAGTLSSLLNS